MEIENGDIVLIKRDAKLNDEGQWVDAGPYRAGHVEIGYIDDTRRVQETGEEIVTKWLNIGKGGFTRKALMIAGARVYRSKASAEEREWIASAVDFLAANAAFSKWKAGTSVFRSKKATCRGLREKYFKRVVQTWQDEGEMPTHVMKDAFCSELAVAATQLGAMMAVAPPGKDSDVSNDEINRVISRAKQHRLWLNTRAKATTPSGLEQVLRSSANWDYLGLYTDGDDAEDLLRLKSVIVRAIAHYNDRTTLGVFKSTSNATRAWLTTLRGLLNLPAAAGDWQGLTAAMLRYAIVWALSGVRLAPGKQSTPWAEGNLMPNLRALEKDSRFYRCLLLAASQGASDQFQFDANELNRVRRAR